jgi:23S rRNA pseudouridine1911/1915/1917 synthase
MPTETDRHHTITATHSDRGLRLDRFLMMHLPELSRSRLQALIRGGHLREAGATIEEPGHRVKPGARYELTVPAAEPAVPAPERVALAIVYEDDCLIVIDKPAGMAVHPGAGRTSGTLVNALIAHCGDSLSGIGGVKRPGIVHRLDKDTTGLIVIAKTDRAHRSLAEQFAAHGADGRLQRSYLAVVWGRPEPRAGTIDARIGRKSSNRTRMGIVSGAAGRHAVTHYEVLECFPGADGTVVASLVRCTLRTGRTHQIRVHMAHIGHPLMGDPTYGAGFAASARKLSSSAAAALAALGRQALHAETLGFAHPATGRVLRFVSQPPADMTRLIAALRASR